MCNVYLFTLQIYRFWHKSTWRQITANAKIHDRPQNLQFLWILCIRDIRLAQFILWVRKHVRALQVWNVVTECFVVTANCAIEVLAYSAYGPGENCSPSVGYVKLDGVTVWQGSWCGSVPNPRGTNILLIDPFTCRMQESRTFDTFTHVSTDAAEGLINYLQQLNQGQIIVGVSADEPRANLDIALSTLRQFGVEVSELRFRGSFGFVAQKGFPSKTVIRKARDEAASRVNPPHFTATVGGITLHCLMSFRL